MKAITDCNWVVDIIRADIYPNGDPDFYWEAETEDNSALYESKLQAREMYGDYETAQKEWEEFAKINNLKNWRWYE